MIGMINFWCLFPLKILSKLFHHYWLWLLEFIGVIFFSLWKRYIFGVAWEIWLFHGVNVFLDFSLNLEFFFLLDRYLTAYSYSTKWCIILLVIGIFSCFHNWCFWCQFGSHIVRNRNYMLWFWDEIRIDTFVKVVFAFLIRDLLDQRFLLYLLTNLWQ